MRSGSLDHFGLKNPGRVRSRLAAAGSAPLLGITMKLVYPKPKPPLNLRESGFEKPQASLATKYERMMTEGEDL